MAKKQKWDDLEMLVAFHACGNCSEIRQEIVAEGRELNRFNYSCRCGGTFQYLGKSPMALIKEREDG